MTPSEMKRDLVVVHPELGEVRLMYPVGPHRLLADGSAIALKPLLERVLVEPSGVERLLAEEEGRVAEPRLSDDLQHTGKFVDDGPCGVWYAVSLSTWEQSVVSADVVAESAVLFGGLTSSRGSS